MSDISKAIDMVYKNLTASNKYPFVVLNLEIPPHDVDVNVHPTKKKFVIKSKPDFNFIYSAIEAGLSNYKESPKSEFDYNTPSFSYNRPTEQDSQIIDFTQSQKDIYLDEKLIRCMFLIRNEKLEENPLAQRPTPLVVVTH